MRAEPGSSPDNVAGQRNCQTSGAAQARREGVTKVNQWLRPLQSSTDSNLADLGRHGAGSPADRWASLSLFPQTPESSEALEKTVMYPARNRRGVAGHRPRQWSSVNVGTATISPSSLWEREGSWSADGIAAGRSPRSSPRSGKPTAWRRGAASTQRRWREETCR
jgi:hypothetical protein